MKIKCLGKTKCLFLGLGSFITHMGKEIHETKFSVITTGELSKEGLLCKSHIILNSIF